MLFLLYYFFTYVITTSCALTNSFWGKLLVQNGIRSTKSDRLFAVLRIIPHCNLYLGTDWHLADKTGTHGDGVERVCPDGKLDRDRERAAACCCSNGRRCQGWWVQTHHQQCNDYSDDDDDALGNVMSLASASAAAAAAVIVITTTSDERITMALQSRPGGPAKR